MKRAMFIAALMMGAPAFAGMHLGLGKAVAKEAAKVFDPAQEEILRNATGDNAAQTLPACGSTRPYKILPTDLSVVAAIDPLGHVNPSGHTFPTDHIYFYMKPVDPLFPSGTRYTANIVAPGDVLITRVRTTEYLSAPIPFIDYTIDFYGCREVKSYFSHVQTIDSALLAKMGNINESCSDYTTGGASVRACSKNLAIPVTMGSPLGTSGPPHSVSFDFGTYDMRTTVPFVSPQRRTGDNLHTVCPLDYFEDNVRLQMEAIVGRFDGGFPRTLAPVCGEIGVDVANTAMGWWYKPGAPNSPDDPHLSLAPDNVNPANQNVASGTSVPGLLGWWTFTPVTTGLVNRGFATVTADSTVYCYDSFIDPAGNPAFTGFRLLLSMPSSSTVKIERDASAMACGAGPFSQTSAAVLFER